MAAKLTKEELMEKTKDIDNEELKKKISELTEDDLRNVVGGTVNWDGSDAGIDIKCDRCHQHNTIAVYSGIFYCIDCNRTFKQIL